MHAGDNNFHDFVIHFMYRNHLLTFQLINFRAINSATKPQDLGKTVQIVQYADNQPTTSLKSLKDVNALVDNISLASNR